MILELDEFVEDKDEDNDKLIDEEEVKEEDIDEFVELNIAEDNDEFKEFNIDGDNEILEEFNIEEDNDEFDYD